MALVEFDLFLLEFFETYFVILPYLVGAVLLRLCGEDDIFSGLPEGDADSGFARRVGAGGVDKIDAPFDCMYDGFHGLSLRDPLDRNAAESKARDLTSRFA